MVYLYLDKICPLRWGISKISAYAQGQEVWQTPICKSNFKGEF